MRSMVRRLSLAIAALAAAALLLGACGGGDDDGGKGIRVVATTTQIGALVREVAGNRVQLTVLLQAGADAHDYEPSPQDSRTIREANLVLKNGIGLDDWMDDLVKNSGTKARVVVATDGVAVLEGDHGEEEHAGDAEKPEDDHAHEEGDPHVWHDPMNVKVMAENVAAALAEVDPDNAAAYRERADAYKARLDEVDAQIRSLVDSIPAANRKLVTNHKALAYFFERYGLELVGAVIPSVSKDAQPSAKELAELSDLVRSEGVKAVFAESEVDPKVAEQLARETGAKLVTGLYADSLGPPGSGAETIDGMLLHNARLIAEALR
ncbi:metal ABC transporter substrate-binding protein [Tepidiforma sp.]|uniref:metal ABC transporter substrate-binding protein n=1 Tax=Tepidiforma sp. TaxID=2682230 RepID=UPI002ADD6E7B|nr:metal ABC transporter substrate-binding protein [Tepidiforma sp.]